MADEKARTLDEAFVSFATKAFLPIVDVLVDSVGTFSTRPIVVYGINTEVAIADRPFLVKRRIHVFGTLRHPWRLAIKAIHGLKSRIILDAPVRHGVYLDADCVVNARVDVLFDWCRQVEDYPLCPRHPQDPDDQWPLMHRLGVKSKSMPYVHGHLVFGERCRRFLEQWNKLCGQHATRAANADETLLNVLLWKHAAVRCLPAYDPYFEGVTDYLRGTVPPGYEGLDVRYLLFHGCKDPARAGEILQSLVRVIDVPPGP